MIVIVTPHGSSILSTRPTGTGGACFASISASYSTASISISGNAATISTSARVARRRVMVPGFLVVRYGFQVSQDIEDTGLFHQDTRL